MLFEKFLYYSLKPHRDFFVKESFETPLYEEEGGLPLDIVCTDKGCCLLVRDSREENILYIEMVSHEGELLWRNNIMHGYGKLITNEKKKFGIWEGGSMKEKLKKNDFYKKINEKYNQFSNFFQLDDYTSIVNYINGDIDDIEE